MKDWQYYLVRGLAFCFIAIALLFNPDEMLSFLSVLLGAYLVVDGILDLINTLQSKKTNFFVLQILKAIFIVVVGIAALISPVLLASVTIVPILTLLGILLLFLGIVEILARKMFPEKKLAMRGLVKILLGILLLLKPLFVTMIFVYVFGVLLGLAGIMYLVLAVLTK